MRRLPLCLIAAAALLGAVPPAAEILPTTRFDANFLNFPAAWTTSTGKGVSVAVVEAGAAEARSGGPVARIKRLAPGARVEGTSPADFFGAGPLLPEKTAPKAPVPAVVLLMAQPRPADRAAALRSVERLSHRGAAVVIPAWFGPMTNIADDDPWVAFVREASAAGAVIVGAHGRAFQVGNLAFWEKLPVDTFALHEGIDGDEYSGPDVLVDMPLESPAPLAAAAIALLKSVEPGLSPALVKEKLRESGRRVIWTRIRFSGEDGTTRDWVLPAMSREACDRRVGAWGAPKPEVGKRFASSSLDAALLLGLPPLAAGEWSRGVLRAAEARRKATGKGITVAILDHMFAERDPLLTGKWFKPGSVIEGLAVYDESGHGTWMARDLIAVAPDVKVMPVRICGPGHDGTAEDYAAGIDYAVANGAKVISLSHRPVEPGRQAVLDAAVDKATRAGVTFVYIHYQGDRPEVVVPGPVEFADYDKGRPVVYVVGTNFVDEESFPYTWGLSQTAPMVSGVAAMMLEVNPALTPARVKEILLGAGRDIGAGRKVLDAAMAVKNCSAGGSTR